MHETEDTISIVLVVAVWSVDVPRLPVRRVPTLRHRLLLHHELLLHHHHLLHLLCYLIER